MEGAQGTVSSIVGGQPQTRPTAERVESSSIPWIQLPLLDSYTDCHKPSQTRVPDELNILPDNAVIPLKLHEILTWSIKRVEDFPPEILLNDPESGTSACWRAVYPLQHNGPASSLEVADNAEDGRSQSTESSRLSRLNGIAGGLLQLRQDVRAKLDLVRHMGGRTEDSVAPDTAVSTKVTEMAECISCFDEIERKRLVHLGCSHDYCNDCLREVISNTMKVESAFPPKCCLTEIPLETVLKSLNSDMREQYKEKAAEYSVPAGQRWYCPNTECARWIKPKALRRAAAVKTCPHCTTKICATCRAQAHPENTDCPQDFGLEATLETAEDEGWRRCYSCRTMVELNQGCRHITCRCGAEFCYVCNARWRTCACTEVDKENRLRELRQRRADREQRQREEEVAANAADAAADAEAEEIALAIAQVEALELAEAERLAEEERLRQLEEDRLLAELEEERVAEQAARLKALETAEQEYRETLFVSIQDDYQSMKDLLCKVTEFEQATLMSRHATAEKTAIFLGEEQENTIVAEGQRLLSLMEANVQKRTRRLRERQKVEQQILNGKLDEEEDRLFLQMHIHLRGKPNSEVRSERMRADLQRQQSEERKQLQDLHATAADRLQWMASIDIEGVVRENQSKLDQARQDHASYLTRVGGSVAADREWFEVVTERRSLMLDKHLKITREQVSAGQEPTGLMMNDVRAIVATLLPSASDEGVEENTTRTAAATGSTGIEEPDLYSSSNQPLSEASLSPAAPFRTAGESSGSSWTTTEAMSSGHVSGSELVASNASSSLVEPSKTLDLPGVFSAQNVALKNYRSQSQSMTMSGTLGAPTLGDLNAPSSDSQSSRPAGKEIKRKKLWSLGRKSKTCTDEEVRRLISMSVGDAF